MIQKLNKAAVSFRVTKADETEPDVLTIEGIATEESEDRSGETMDYESSKPFFERWRDSIFQATGGKSQGNVREQHDSEKAVGKVTELIFDDVKKQIRIVARIVDKDTIRKILAGVLSAFSIAGTYVRRWIDGDVLRFTVSPCEISVVDFPALPSATLTVVTKSGVLRRTFTEKGEVVMTRSDHQECAKRSLAMATHHEALGKLHREAHQHHVQMAAAGTTAAPKAATSTFGKTTNLDDDFDNHLPDASGGLRKAVSH